MDDATKSLAFALHSGKGVYALLLGSGVSRSAGILTGWDIVLDLIRRLAVLEKADCEPNPEVWYRKKFGKEPDYAVLLEKLAKTPSERNLLLRQYFEPTEEEKAAKQKTPSPAHKAIASLVSRGIVRVVVTTNFDTLLEQALEAQGVSPSVVSTTDAIKGMMPLVHNRCTIVKVHGDYRDTRIRNTETELAKYDKPTKQLLDRILDEYGLVVCGWSAEWDTALRAAIERCPNRRFSTYWAVKDALTENAKRLVEQRGADVLQIADADTFFTTLEANVLSLEQYTPPSPRSKSVAVDVLKRNLESNQWIVVRDFLRRSQEEALVAFQDPRFSPQGPQPTPEAFLSRMRLYESQMEILAALFATVCYWGDATYHATLVSLLETLGSRRDSVAGYTAWDEMRIYPAVPLLYSGGIAALFANRLDTLATLIIKPMIHTRSHAWPVHDHLRPTTVVDPDALRGTKEYEHRKTPVSDHLHGLMKVWLKQYYLSEQAFDDVFDRFEYLFALTCAQRSKSLFLGRFAWRYHSKDRDSLMGKAESEIGSAGMSWPPIQSGLLDGPVDKLLETKSHLDTEASRLRWYR